MNNFDTLYHHPGVGYVIRSKPSGMLILAYSILKIGFYPDEFQQFRRCLTYLIDKYAQSLPDETLKAISIPTPDPGMEITLSLAELKQLYNIIEMADSEMKALDMASLFNEETT